MELEQLIKKLDQDNRTIFESAVATAVEKNHFLVTDVHFIYSFLKSNSILVSVLNTTLDLSQLSQDFNLQLAAMDFGNEGYPTIDTKLVRILYDSWIIASSDYDSLEIIPEYVLLAMYNNQIYKSELHRISNELSKINSDIIRQYIHSSQKSDVQIDHRAQTSALFKYAQNLTEQAAQGEFDTIVGRDHETRQLIDVLSRRRKNNPILVGEAGVGKTAVVEGLALKVSKGDVPGCLLNTAILSLDVGALQAGASVKGEFENRLKAVIKEIQNYPHPAILFVDEAHTLLSSKHAGTQNDAANLLKPALARGELRTIAATTWSEYKQNIESDPALERRFQYIKIDEPQEEQAITMLNSVIAHLEKHHKVHILQEAVESAVRLSKRFISGKQLPDKGVSLLDTACARVSLSQQTIPAQLENCSAEKRNMEHTLNLLIKEESFGFKNNKIEELKEKISQLNTTIQQVEQQYDETRIILESINNIRKELETTHLSQEESLNLTEELSLLRRSFKEVQAGSHLMHECVDSEVIAAVIADWTGIPLKQMQSDEIQKILNLSEVLSQRVIGQDPALQLITQSLQNAHAKLQDPDRPLAVLMLVGPSGVGKTETALALAEHLYGSAQQLTTINMSEFKESHKVSLLMGAPPGYAGYGKGGLLTEAVRRKPYSVILLDELEKADKAIHEMFYQVFDKGVLRDSEGRDVDFKQTLIIMTSNTASDHIEHLCSDSNNLPELNTLLDAIQPSLRRDFDPAFLGRVTLIPYYPLTSETLELIVKQQLCKIENRILSFYKIPFSYTQKVIDSLVSQCRESDIGARLVVMNLNNNLLPKLSKAILTALAQKQELKSISIDLDNNNQWIIQM